MKKKIYSILVSTLFIFLFIYSSTNSNLSAKNINFVKNAKASGIMICTWNLDVRVCCFSEPQGDCLILDSYEWDGPYYDFH